MIIKILIFEFVLNLNLDIRNKKDPYTVLYSKIFLFEKLQGGMYMSRNYSNKNLSELELGNIEFYLNQRKGYTSIGKLLNRTEATIR